MHWRVIISSLGIKVYRGSTPYTTLADAVIGQPSTFFFTFQKVSLLGTKCLLSTFLQGKASSK